MLCKFTSVFLFCVFFVILFSDVLNNLLFYYFYLEYFYNSEVDLSVGFTSVNVDIEASEIDEFTFGDIEFYGVSACHCQTDFTCSPPNTVVEQTEKVGICVTTSSAVVQYTDYNLTVTGDGPNNFMYEPVVEEVGLFGTTIETQGQVTKISFPLVTGLFDDTSDEVVIVGNGILEFVDTSNGRRRRRAIKLVASETDARILQESESGQADERGFDMQVLVNPPKQQGCFVTLMNKIKEQFKF